MSVVINGRFLSQKISGVQRFAIEITKAIIEINPEIQILCPPDADISKEYLQNWNIKKIGTHTGHAWEQWDLPRYLTKNENPILLNFCNLGPLLYSNNVITLHDVSFAVHKEWHSLSFRMYYNFVVPRLLKKAKAIFTGNEISKQEIIATYGKPAASFHLIPSAVSSKFNLKESEIGLAQKQKIVLSVSSIDPRKNQKILIEAFEKVDNKEWTLCLVGSKHKAFKQTEETIYSSNIRWTGYVEDAELVALYKSASFFVYPSLHEGFGIPPLEAMSAGCPVLSSNIPVLMNTCGDAALYFDPTNSDQLADQIKNMILDDKLRLELMNKGLAKSKEYSWSESAKKVMQVVIPLQKGE